MTKVLVLGGTEEARALAAALEAAGVPFEVSLAGVTAAPEAGAARSGGFGGVDGLAAVLREEGFGLLVDATHPFAATISPNARQAARKVGVPYHRLERPPWRPAAGDDWQDVASLEEAAARLVPGSTVFLAVGARSLPPFLKRNDVRLVLRAIEPPDVGTRDDIVIVRARGPFTARMERALWDEHGFDMLVTKNSGGHSTEAKLRVARERRTPVLMVARPDGQPAPDAATAGEMMVLLRPHL